MIRFAADEDFNNDIVRALRRALPEVNIRGVREAGRGGQRDPEVLAWAAAEARVLLTHDVTTMTRHALESRWRVTRSRVGNSSGGLAR
jgi:predicted nuclease of predicted toxin-antitoxin system